MTLTQGHGCDVDKQKIAYLQDKVRTTQPIATKLDCYILIWSWSTSDKILEEFCLESFFGKFSSKISEMFF